MINDLLLLRSNAISQVRAVCTTLKYSTCMGSENKLRNRVLNPRVYVFSDLFPLRHVSMCAVNDNDHVYHVSELT